jgi:hypothetical protein
MLVEWLCGIDGAVVVSRELARGFAFERVWLLGLLVDITQIGWRTISVPAGETESRPWFLLSMKLFWNGSRLGKICDRMIDFEDEVVSVKVEDSRCLEDKAWSRSHEHEDGTMGRRDNNKRKARLCALGWEGARQPIMSSVVVLPHVQYILL